MALVTEDADEVGAGEEVGEGVLVVVEVEMMTSERRWEAHVGVPFG